MKKLQNDMESARQYGAIRLHIAQISNPNPSHFTQHLNELMAKAGLHSIGDNWREIDPKLARATIRKCLMFDTVYWASLVDEATAEVLTDRFLWHFDREYNCFGNFQNRGNPACVIGKGESFSYFPTAGWTSEIGIGVISQDSIGVIWFMDED